MRVALGHLLALLHFFVEDGELGQQYGGLQGIQAAVHAHADVVIAPVLPVPGNLAHDLGQFVVAGKDGAAVAVAAQGFAGEEAGAGNGGQVAAFAALVRGAKALRGVFDHGDAVPGRYGVDGVVIGALAIQAHGDDGLGMRGDGGFDAGGVQVQRVGVHVHKHRLDAVPKQRVGGGHE